MDGILPVDKPTGWTSHDVVARVRRLSGVRRVGHAGTLDPLATGVLLLCLGRATRVVSYLTDAEKEYRTRLRLGVATDTFDAEGQVIFRSEAVPSDPEVVRNAVRAFEGEIEQVPPMFSAVKVGGKKLYEMARRGEAVARTPRKVFVRRIEVEGIEGADLDLRVVCSKGTYIRALADDLGQRLGCGAHVTALRRTRVGDFSLPGCLTLEKVAAACETGGLSALVLSADRALSHLPTVRLDGQRLRRFCSGAEVMAADAAFSEGGEFRVDGEDGLFYGIGAWVREGALRARVVLRDLEEFKVQNEK